MAIKRMDDVGVVVESLDTAISFFAEPVLELERRATIQGEWAGRATGLRDQDRVVSGSCVGPAHPPLPPAGARLPLAVRRLHG